MNTSTAVLCNNCIAKGLSNREKQLLHKVQQELNAIDEVPLRRKLADLNTEKISY